MPSVVLLDAAGRRRSPARCLVTIAVDRRATKACATPPTLPPWRRSWRSCAVLARPRTDCGLGACMHKKRPRERSSTASAPGNPLERRLEALLTAPSARHGPPRPLAEPGAGTRAGVAALDATRACTRRRTQRAGPSTTRESPPNHPGSLLRPHPFSERASKPAMGSHGLQGLHARKKDTPSAVSRA